MKWGILIKTFCFTVDDNIRFLKEITENHYQSIFEHPYLAMYMRLHETFGLKVQLNLFYRTENFDLSQMSDLYRSEWEANSDWLKLSFHSDLNNGRPYEFSDYNEVYRDCNRVNEQIKRFASPAALADTTTVHFCLTTKEGVRALEDNQILGLLGLFGSREKPIFSYSIDPGNAEIIRNGNVVKIGKMSFGSIDIVLNLFSTEQIIARLQGLTDRNGIRVMIHEQYFYDDFPDYQPEFEEKLGSTFSFLTKHGYRSSFFEDLLNQ